MRILGLVVLGLVLLIGLLPVVAVAADLSTPMPTPVDSDGTSQVVVAVDSLFDGVVIAPRLRELTPEPTAPSKVEFAPTPRPPNLNLPPQPPTLIIDEEIPGAFGVPVTVPIELWGSQVVAVLAFSLNYDESCLSFDATDSDLDGIPDSVSVFSPTDVGLVSVQFDGADTDGEIDIVVADISEPIGALGIGTLLEIQFTPICNPGPGQTIAVPIGFSSSPSASFSGSEGQDWFGATHDGSVLLGTPVSTATPTPTATPTAAPTSTPTPTPTPIPSLTWWGLIAMAGVLAALYLWRVRYKPFTRRVL